MDISSLRPRTLDSHPKPQRTDLPSTRAPWNKFAAQQAVTAAAPKQLFNMSARVVATSALPQPIAPGKELENSNLCGLVCFFGHGVSAFSATEVMRLRDSAAACMHGATFCIGDPAEGASLGRLREPVAHMAAAHKAVTVFVMTHGKVGTTGLEVRTTPKNWVSAKQVLETIAEFVDPEMPATVCFATCHSGAVMTEVNTLPKGSVVIALCGAADSLPGQDVVRATQRLVQSDTLPLREWSDILFNHLFAMKNRFSPIVAKSGEHPAVTLNTLLRNYVGKGFTETERAAVYHILGRFASQIHLDASMTKISSASSEWSISANEYGACLAVCYAISLGIAPAGLHDLARPQRH